MKKHLLLAVVDLGSNSFRLESGFFVGNDFHSTAYVKQNLRLGASLEPERGLSAEAMQQGWDCLRDFGVRLRSLGVDRACAVATQTLREASNGQIFIDRGSELLGVPIQLISGEQEADFIYRGGWPSYLQGRSGAWSWIWEGARPSWRWGRGCRPIPWPPTRWGVWCGRRVSLPMVG